MTENETLFEGTLITSDGRHITGWYRYISKDEFDRGAPEGLEADPLPRISAAVFTAIESWTMATPESYAMRTDLERMQYHIWVKAKQLVERERARSAQESHQRLNEILDGLRKRLPSDLVDEALTEALTPTPSKAPRL